MPIPFFNNFKKQAPPPNGGDLPKTQAPEITEHMLPVNEARMVEWNNILRSYKNSRSIIENKIKSNERFWRMRQWKSGEQRDGEQVIPSTAWLFSCIQSKLADVMDSYPTANFRPRQKDDVEEAKRLSSILPVIVAQNNFEQTYKSVSEYTLKNGVGVYHVFWDGKKHNGLGDIAIEKTDVLKIFWEPGITDLQDSTYVFTVELVDQKLLRQRYPELAASIRGKVIDPAKFVTDERVNTQDKIVVVDVYYRTEYNGRKILHYCKYADTTCLESTENNPEQYPNGLYDHAMYPFEVQTLYNIESSLYGTGMVDIGADAQIQIDLMNEAVVKNTLMGAQPRYLTTLDASEAEREFADWTKTFVHVASISDTTTKPVSSTPLQGNYLEFIQSKIQELKHVTSNQDVNNGAAPSGITAASAIAALQETSGKDSRFINKTFYNTYGRIMKQVIELIRQFYDVPRWFRILPDQAQGGGEVFVEYDNQGLVGVPQTTADGQDAGFRVPEFDIEITAEKANPYKKMEINELAISFFKLGFFNPQMTDQALACLQMMDFDHKDDVTEMISRNGTLLDQLMMIAQLAVGLAQQYGDISALQAIQQVMMQSGQPIPGGGNVDPVEVANPDSKTGEARHVEKARAQARSSTEAS